MLYAHMQLVVAGLRLCSPMQQSLQASAADASLQIARRQLHLRAEVGRGKGRADSDPARPYVVVLPEELQPPPAHHKVLNDVVHLLWLLVAAVGRLLAAALRYSGQLGGCVQDTETLVF